MVGNFKTFINQSMKLTKLFQTAFFFSVCFLKPHDTFSEMFVFTISGTMDQEITIRYDELSQRKELDVTQSSNPRHSRKTGNSPFPLWFNLFNIIQQLLSTLLEKNTISTNREQIKPCRKPHFTLVSERILTPVKNCKATEHLICYISKESSEHFIGNQLEYHDNQPNGPQCCEQIRQQCT